MVVATSINVKHTTMATMAETKVAQVMALHVLYILNTQHKNNIGTTLHWQMSFHHSFSQTAMQLQYCSSL